jgi:hypothetical protein
MSAHARVVRLLGAITLALALSLAAFQVFLLWGASQLASTMAALAIESPEAAPHFAAQGLPQREVSAAYQHALVVKAWQGVAPDLVRAALGLAAGALLILRRRGGAPLALLFAAWPFGTGALRWLWGAWEHRASRLLFLPDAHTDFSYQLPLATRSVSGLELGALTGALRLGYLALVIAILVWAARAERRHLARDDAP